MIKIPILLTGLSIFPLNRMHILWPQADIQSGVFVSLHRNVRRRDWVIFACQTVELFLGCQFSVFQLRSLIALDNLQCPPCPSYLLFFMSLRLPVLSFAPHPIMSFTCPLQLWKRRSLIKLTFIYQTLWSIPSLCLRLLPLQKDEVSMSWHCIEGPSARLLISIAFVVVLRVLAIKESVVRKSR